MLSISRMRELLEALNAELEHNSVRGELFLAGGAVMCLVFRAREATKDIDALLIPASELRSAAKRIAEREHLPEDWLNDAVKGFFSQTGRFEVYEELSNLRIFAPHPEYLLAMKCMAMRLGEEYHDREDVAALLRILGPSARQEITVPFSCVVYQGTASAVPFGAHNDKALAPVRAGTSGLSRFVSRRRRHGKPCPNTKSDMVIS